ncbi:MAG: BolA family transcriptional regulator [Ectothiorhodospiraceae bacterium]|nr:BolA family transcriptional regulator [Ectothiorhodospiraceae bacterium]
MNPAEIERLIAAGLETDHVAVSGDGRHFEAIVVSSAFAGKAVLAQHRMVYATLGDRFDRDELHALSIKTFTPEQWARTGRG